MLRRQRCRCNALTLQSPRMHRQRRRRCRQNAIAAKHRRRHRHKYIDDAIFTSTSTTLSPHRNHRNALTTPLMTPAPLRIDDASATSHRPRYWHERINDAIAITHRRRIRHDCINKAIATTQSPHSIDDAIITSASITSASETQLPRVHRHCSYNECIDNTIATASMTQSSQVHRRRHCQNVLTTQLPR